MRAYRGISQAVPKGQKAMRTPVITTKEYLFKLFNGFITAILNFKCTILLTSQGDLNNISQGSLFHKPSQ